MGASETVDDFKQRKGVVCLGVGGGRKTVWWPSKFGARRVNTHTHKKNVAEAVSSVPPAPLSRSDGLSHTHTHARAAAAVMVSVGKRAAGEGRAREAG